MWLGHESTSRVTVHLVVLAVCADALLFVLSTRPVQTPTGRFEQSRGAVEGSPPAHGRWLVKVDGWTLQLDGVERGALAAVARLLDRDTISGARPHSFPYVDIIARHAANAGLDWRLIASLIVEESGFNPTAESSAGAYGLMQVRDIAARDVNESQFRSPEANIRTGVRYLRRLLDLFPTRDPQDGLALALAAYNMGPAHVADAQTVAAEHGYDPLRWYDSLELIVPLLEEPGIYRRLPNGFARGRETARYVDSVLRRFGAFRRTAAATPNGATVATSG